MSFSIVNRNRRKKRGIIENASKNSMGSSPLSKLVCYEISTFEGFLSNFEKIGNANEYPNDRSKVLIWKKFCLCWWELWLERPLLNKSSNNCIKVEYPIKQIKITFFSLEKRNAFLSSFYRHIPSWKNVTIQFHFQKGNLLSYFFQVLSIWSTAPFILYFVN